MDSWACPTSCSAYSIRMLDNVKLWKAPSDAALLAECEVDTYRASGPGGQNRNKVETAVRLRHKPTGLSVIAEESRSQAENRPRALRRLRMAIPLRVRRPAGAAAARLGRTTGNLAAFLTADVDLLAETNRMRAAFGLRPLRRD